MIGFNLPAAFSRRIQNAFGERGSRWLAGLPGLLATCRDRWELTALSLAPELSYNLVCYAQSPVYGPVVLKMGVPHPELDTEMKALPLFAGRGGCACYDADPALGALLLERILPGTDLTTVRERSERFRIAAGLIAALPAAIAGSDESGFPSFAGWLAGAFDRVRREGRAGADLLALVGTAERLFAQEINSGRPRRLLHGDLHHWNILQDGSGRWKAIDPKGVIGPAGLEAARFIRNEFALGDRAGRMERLDQMVSLFSEYLGEPKQFLAAAAFVDSVLGACWSLEENPAPAALESAVAESAVLLGYYRLQGP